MSRAADEGQEAEALHRVEVEEVRLPGVGVRRDFATREGRRVGVVYHRSGRRELVVYDRRDPDRCSESVGLHTEEADALAELLGAPRVVENLAALREQLPHLVTEQLPIPAGSRFAGRTLGDTRLRTLTGASVVAVLRGSELIASPRPDFPLEAEDSLVVVGTPEGLERAAQLLSS